MKRKFLEDLGLEKDAIDKIINQNSEDIGSYKKQVEQLTETKAKFENDLRERDKQLEDLQKSTGDVTALQAKITKLQEDNKKMKDDYDEKELNRSYDSAIEKALANAIHPDLVSGKIDRAKLKLNEDGTVFGLDEQVKGLKESYKDLFKPNKTGKTPPDPEGDPSIKKVSEMNYAELAAYHAEHPDATLD